jgi:hypothetical protein
MRIESRSRLNAKAAKAAKKNKKSMIRNTLLEGDAS